MTVKQAASYIGRTGHLTSEVGGFRVRVRVLDARTAWGRLDLFVTPTDGEGATWVESRRVHLEDKC